MAIQCFSCRKFGAPAWYLNPDLSRREMVTPCCRESTGEVGATPDIAQWLRTRIVKVASLVRAARHVPGLTCEMTA